MRGSKKSVVFWLIGFVLVFSLLGFGKYRMERDSGVFVSVVFKAEKDGFLQMFYNNGKPFTSAKTYVTKYKGSTEFQSALFHFPKSYEVKNIRFDLDMVDATFLVKEIGVSDEKVTINLDAQKIFKVFETNNYIKGFYYDDENDWVKIETAEGDPYIFTEDLSELFDEIRMPNNHQRLFYNVAFSVMVLLLVFLIKTGFDFKFILRQVGQMGFKQWFAAVFVLIVFAPFVINTLHIFVTSNNMENRHLAKMPVFSEVDLTEYLGEYNDYFKDNFGLRSQMITANNAIHFRYLDEIPSKTCNVEMGDDKWLFVSAYLAAAYYVDVTAPELSSIAENLAQRAEFCENLGAKYYVIIPPTKSSAYKEFRPMFYKKMPEKNTVSNVLHVLGKEPLINVVDVRPALAQIKALYPYPIYYKFDSHWNSSGAKTGYDVLMNKIKVDFPDIHPIPSSDYVLSFDSTYEADLLKSIAMGDMLERTEVVYTPKFDSKVIDGIPKPYGHIARFKDNVNGDTLKVMVFHDSFGVALMPFLSETFKRNIFLWTTDFRHDLIEKERPDIVIQERMESYVSDFITPNTPEFMERLEWSRTLNDSIPE